MITDGNDATFQRTFWSGTFVEFNAGLYGVPSSMQWSTDNVIVVDKGVLTIDRHGNNVEVTLNKELSIKKPLVSASSPTAFFKLPSFSLELSSYGEAYHRTAGEKMSGWLGGSGYTIVHDDLRFDANGVFASEGTFLDGVSTINGNLIMHGTHTFYYP